MGGFPKAGVNCVVPVVALATTTGKKVRFFNEALRPGALQRLHCRVRPTAPGAGDA